jgi:hypothetical protein
LNKLGLASTIKQAKKISWKRNKCCLGCVRINC